MANQDLQYTNIKSPSTVVANSLNNMTLATDSENQNSSLHLNNVIDHIENIEQQHRPDVRNSINIVNVGLASNSYGINQTQIKVERSLSDQDQSAPNQSIYQNYEVVGKFELPESDLATVKIKNHPASNDYKFR